MKFEFGTVPLTKQKFLEQMEMGYFEIFAVDPKQKLATTWGNLKTPQR